MPIRVVKRPRAASDGASPDCSDTSLQSLYRHWTTSFRFVELTISLPQFLSLSKQNAVAGVIFFSRYGFTLIAGPKRTGPAGPPWSARGAVSVWAHWGPAAAG